MRYPAASDLFIDPNSHSARIGYSEFVSQILCVRPKQFMKYTINNTNTWTYFTSINTKIGARAWGYDNQIFRYYDMLNNHWRNLD